jgi:tetratricopeptide (TPR) repeat protein
LAVFPATFDAAAEEVVCADTGHVQLTDLVRRSLVLYDKSTKRYRLHDLARLFADAKLNQEEHSNSQKRFATHYRDVLAAAKELYKEGGESMLRGLSLFDLEWGNIQEGHAWVATQSDAMDTDVAWLGMTYPKAGVYVLDLRQHSRERIRWLEIALSAARQLQDREGEGSTLGNLGVAYGVIGETHRAIQFFEQQLAIVREIGDRKGEGSALGNLGNAYAALGETSGAVQFFEQALLMDREIGYRRGEGKALGNLGTIYGQLGETHRAIQFFERQLVIVREIGYRRGEGNALGNLGTAYGALGEISRAIQFFEHALLIDREIGDRRGEGTVLWNMSLALDQLGERAQAVQYAEQALTICEQIEDPNAVKVRAQLAEWREQTNT